MEGSNMDLNSNDSFYYLWVNWRLVGLYPFSKWKYLYFVYSLFLNITVSLMVPISLYIYTFKVTSFGLMLSNLSVSFTFTVATLKLLITYIFMENLSNVQIYLKNLDDRAMKHSDERKYLQEMVKFCHKMYYVFSVIFILTLISFACSGYARNRLPFEGWSPFDWTASRASYWYAFVYQLFSTLIVVFQNVSNDLYPPTYIVVLIGHIHVLSMRVSKIAIDPNKTEEENYDELVNCIKDHKNILKYLNSITPVISGTIFVQFLVTAIIICVNAAYFLYFGQQFFQMLNVFFYTTAIILEVFPCCYYMNELMQESDDLTSAIFTCNWVDQNLKFKKTLVFFMQRSQQRNVIVAGKFLPATLPTLLSIFRLSFSMFAILRQMK